jgi:hypothetical protein
MGMIHVPETDANRQKLARLTAAWRELLIEALRRGFNGTAAIEVAVQDGTIQHIRKKVERMEK